MFLLYFSPSLLQAARNKAYVALSMPSMPLPHKGWLVCGACLATLSWAILQLVVSIFDLVLGPCDIAIRVAKNRCLNCLQDLSSVFP